MGFKWEVTKQKEKWVCVTHRLQLLKAGSTFKCWNRRPKSSKRLWPKATAGQQQHHHHGLPAACGSKPVFTCPTYLQTQFFFLLTPPFWCSLWTESSPSGWSGQSRISRMKQEEDLPAAVCHSSVLWGTWKRKKKKKKNPPSELLDSAYSAVGPEPPPPPRQ